MSHQRREQLSPSSKFLSIGKIRDANKENWTPKKLVFNNSKETNGSPKKSTIPFRESNKENSPNVRPAPKSDPLSHQKEISKLYANKSKSQTTTPKKIGSPKKCSSPTKKLPPRELKLSNPNMATVFTWLPYAVKFLTYKKKKVGACDELKEAMSVVEKTMPSGSIFESIYFFDFLQVSLSLLITHE